MRKRRSVINIRLINKRAVLAIGESYSPIALQPWFRRF